MSKKIRNRIFLLGLLLLNLLFVDLATSSRAFAQTPQNELLGTWLFHKYKYRGKELPAPNPDLQMFFSFLPDGTNQLMYYRTGQEGFCERKATFNWDGQVIRQKTYWVNEKNAIECSSDPDMQPGREANNRLYILDDQLNLEMPLSDDVITFIWKRTSFLQ